MFLGDAPQTQRECQVGEEDDSLGAADPGSRPNLLSTACAAPGRHRSPRSPGFPLPQHLDSGAPQSRPGRTEAASSPFRCTERKAVAALPPSKSHWRTCLEPRKLWEGRRLTVATGQSGRESLHTQGQATPRHLLAGGWGG